MQPTPAFGSCERPPPCSSAAASATKCPLLPPAAAHCSHHNFLFSQAKLLEFVGSAHCGVLCTMKLIAIIYALAFVAFFRPSAATFWGEGACALALICLPISLSSPLHQAVTAMRAFSVPLLPDRCWRCSWRSKRAYPAAAAPRKWFVRAENAAPVPPMCSARLAMHKTCA